MKRRLTNVEWFSNAGNANTDVAFAMPIERVKSKEECLKHINSLKWENFVLYAFNRLSSYVKSFHSEQAADWNDVAKQAHLQYKELEDLLVEYKTELDMPDDILIDIKSIYIYYFIEQHYLEVIGDEIPIHFKQLVDIYSSGHIPCGWNGPIPKNEGYEAINFEKGKILIW